jgi:hypothetical protein
MEELTGILRLRDLNVNGSEKVLLERLKDYNVKKAGEKDE